MFSQIQTYNDKAMVTSAALQKLILEGLPQEILDHMHTVDLMGKPDQEIITIITNTGRTAEKWKATRMNLMLKATLKAYDRKFPINEKFEKKSRRRDRADESRTDQSRRKFKIDRSEQKSKKDSSKTQGVEYSEIEQSRAAGECRRCTWPADRKGAHRVKDCMSPIKLDKGTASFPKPKEYQKMKIAGLEVDGNEEDESSSDSSDCDGLDSTDFDEELEEASEGEYLDESEDKELQE